MSARKKAEKKPESEETVQPEEAPEMSEGESGGLGGGIGGGMGMGDMLPKETQMHLFKAATELAMAFENIVPKKHMPDEVKQHATAAQREFLLMLRAILDHQISRVDDKCCSAPEKEPRVKKIDVQ
jgi:hypothetical protein